VERASQVTRGAFTRVENLTRAKSNKKKRDVGNNRNGGRPDLPKGIERGGEKKSVTEFRTTVNGHPIRGRDAIPRETRKKCNAGDGL